jgi:hypothetical protein
MPFRPLQIAIFALLVSNAGFSAAAVAQSTGDGARPIQTKGISPEATKVLAPQSDSRGRLLPLHSASVLEWLCSDPNVLGQLKANRAACYREMRLGLSTCEGQMQQKLPMSRSSAAVTGKPDIVAFRQQLRQCIQQTYVQRQLAGGSAVAELSSESPDPVARAMGGTS